MRKIKAWLVLDCGFVRDADVWVVKDGSWFQDEIVAEIYNKGGANMLVHYAKDGIVGLPFPESLGFIADGIVYSPSCNSVFLTEFSVNLGVD